MKSEWFVSMNPGIGFQVVRIRNLRELDHSGNREVFAIYETKEEAQAKAHTLNQEEFER